MGADDTFNCPKCFAKLQIPAHLYVEREIKESGSPYVKLGTGDAPRRGSMPCPMCGHAIPIDHILRRNTGTWFDTIGCIVGMVILFAIIIYFSKGC